MNDNIIWPTLFHFLLGQIVIFVLYKTGWKWCCDNENGFGALQEVFCDKIGFYLGNQLLKKQVSKTSWEGEPPSPPPFGNAQ